MHGEAKRVCRRKGEVSEGGGEGAGRNEACQNKAGPKFGELGIFCRDFFFFFSTDPCSVHTYESNAICTFDRDLHLLRRASSLPRRIPPVETPNARCDARPRRDI